MVVLRSISDAHGSRHLDATLEQDGSLLIRGQDLGDGVENVFGAGQREYEWAWRVAPEHVPALTENLAGALQSSPDLGVIALLYLLYDEHAPGRIEDFIGPDPAGIPAAFWSRLGE